MRGPLKLQHRKIRIGVTVVPHTVQISDYKDQFYKNQVKFAIEAFLSSRANTLQFLLSSVS